MIPLGTYHTSELCTFSNFNRTAYDHYCFFHSDLLLGTPREQKVLVYYSCLLDLFRKCNNCGSNEVLNKPQFFGTCVRIMQTCNLGHQFEWESQPKFGSIYGGNLLLSSAILFAGALPSQVLHVMSFLSCASISESTFYRHQRQYLQPTVRKLRHDEQAQLILRACRTKKTHLFRR